MYKIKVMMVFVATAVIMTACNSNQAGINNNVISEQNPQSVLTEVVQENKEPSESVQNQANEGPDHDKWASLPEYNTIIQKIGKEEYNFRTVTDNAGKRILLIDKDGEEQYKTIFIKNTKHLKIIKIDGNGQIFNGTLK